MNTELYNTYFNNLSATVDLRQFSKEFINHQLKSKIIHLFGKGNKGKSTLIKLLSQIVPVTFIDLRSLNLDALPDSYLIVPEQCEPWDMDFWIPVLLTSNNTFIFISNHKLPENELVCQIEFTAFVNDPNMETKMCEDIDGLKTFINSY